MSYLVPVLRLLVVVAGAAAIVATFLDTATRATINPFNFFGFFTIQSNIIMIVVFAVVAIVTLRGRPRPQPVDVARGCATAYIIIVGAVYNTLLVGLEGGVSLLWANTVLHLVVPLYAAADWALFDDRRPLPWNRLWIVLLYPVVWTTVVLVRGATDGWVPYPFLDPALGYGVVSAYCLGIAIATIAASTIVWGLSRIRILHVARARSSAARSSG